MIISNYANPAVHNFINRADSIFEFQDKLHIHQEEYAYDQKYKN